LGILRSIESRLERVVEGSVGRLFRASVAPVELARKLAKELEEGKVVSVTQTYAPNEYTVFLSPRDRTRFADFEASLRNELASYLAEHARRAGYVMPTRPRVRFETESSLHTGIFGISTALVRDDDAPIEPPEAPAAGAYAPSPAPEATPPPPFPQELPEQPVRSPLDPDPSEAGPAGFPVFPLEPEPEPEPEPAAEPESEPEPVSESESSFSPHLPDAPPVIPGVPLHEDLPMPPVSPLPPVPLPDLPAMPLPDAPGIPTGDPGGAPADPDVPPRPPEPEPEPEPEAPLVSRGFELPVDPPLEATMITRPEAREELVIVHDGQRTPIEASVVQIGRAPGCDIVLDDRNVSRRHAEIRRRGPVVVLIDLDSTNGTIVNGRRVREHPLADGDRITLGNSRLTFERRTT
jgi:hypothetical protein